MTPDDLKSLISAVEDRRHSLAQNLAGIQFASPDAPSADTSADTMMEALFLRTFTSYEADLEKLFLHYVTGGSSVSGRIATSYLAINCETHARRMIVNGFKFLSWAKPSAVRDTAANYLDRGWPIIDMLATQSQNINDCEKIRNRIAHRSIEANSDFLAVQRNLFQTERAFEMSPGHLLRARYRGRKKHTIQYYSELLSETLLAITDPPA